MIILNLTSGEKSLFQNTVVDLKKLVGIGNGKPYILVMTQLMNR